MPSIYSDREVAQIIERAVMLQEEARHREGTVGLSLDEIERMGREVGIDPEHLRRAAAEVDAGAAERSSRTTSTHNHVERWTAGPLDPIDYEDAMEGLADTLGTDYGRWFGRSDSGRPVQHGLTRTWEHTSGLGVHTVVTVSERDDRTRVRLKQQVGLASPPVEGALYGLSSMLLLGPLALALGNGLADGTLAGALSAVFALVLYAVASLTIYKLDVAWRAKKQRDLEETADRLALALAPSETAREAESLREAAREPRLSLDSLPDAPEADAPEADTARASGRERA